MIPKIIHQIWIGDKRIPKHIGQWMQEIKDAHPNYTYYLWTDRNLPKLPEALSHIYHNSTDPITWPTKSDLLRIYIVYKYGGVYMDADFKLIDGLNNLSDEFENKDGIITVSDTYGMEALGNNFFAFDKNHFMLQLLMDDINSVHQWIGPNYWANTISNYFGYDELVTFDRFESDLSNHNIKLLNTSELETKYFQHVALASWLPGSEWNKKFKQDGYE